MLAASPKLSKESRYGPRKDVTNDCKSLWSGSIVGDEALEGTGWRERGDVQRMSYIKWKLWRCYQQ